MKDEFILDTWNLSLTSVFVHGALAAEKDDSSATIWGSVDDNDQQDKVSETRPGNTTQVTIGMTLSP